jgi:hypothetical protein
VTEELQASLAAFEQAAREGRLSELLPLGESLTNQWR